MPACNIDTWVLAQLEYFQHCANIQVETHRRNVNKTLFSHPYQIAVPRFRHWAFHPHFHSLWPCSEGWFGRGALICRDLLMSIWAGNNETEAAVISSSAGLLFIREKKKKTLSLIQRRKGGLCCWEGFRGARPHPDVACDGIYAHPLCRSLCKTEAKALWVRCIIKQQ